MAATNEMIQNKPKKHEAKKRPITAPDKKKKNKTQTSSRNLKTIS
jgi:hypothetical protein